MNADLPAEIETRAGALRHDDPRVTGLLSLLAEIRRQDLDVAGAHERLRIWRRDAGL
jgi:hypothetical protein